MKSIHVALRKHSLNAGCYHSWGDILSQFGQKPSGYRSHYKPDSSHEDVKGNGQNAVLSSWIPHPKKPEGQAVNEDFEEVGGEISLKRDPVMFQVSLPARENPSL